MSNAVAVGKTRRNLVVPDDLWEDLEVLAARRHSTVTAEIIRAVVEALDRAARQQP